MDQQLTLHWNYYDDSCHCQKWTINRIVYSNNYNLDISSHNLLLWDWGYLQNKTPHYQTTIGGTPSLIDVGDFLIQVSFFWQYKHPHPKLHNKEGFGCKVIKIGVCWLYNKRLQLNYKVKQSQCGGDNYNVVVIIMQKQQWFHCWHWWTHNMMVYKDET